MPIFGYCQIQIGEDIDGEVANDNSGYGVSTSSNGNIVAVSAKNNEGVNGIDSGHVRVLENINGTWTQIVQDIDGEAANDKSGHKIQLASDGNRIAISAENNNGTNGVDSGHVRVFENMDGVWTQIGQDIDGDVEGDKSGYGMAFSKNGNIVSIGAYRNDTGAHDVGQVRVFEFNGVDWFKWVSQFMVILIVIILVDIFPYPMMDIQWL